MLAPALGDSGLLPPGLVDALRQFPSYSGYSAALGSNGTSDRIRRIIAPEHLGLGGLFQLGGGSRVLLDVLVCFKFP